jgi:hypothetical protein
MAWDGHLPGQVKYRLVSRTVPLEGETLPGPLARAETGFHSEGLSPVRAEALSPCRGLRARATGTFTDTEDT